MLKETLKNSSIVYYADYCEKCGGVSHWGELVAIRVDKILPKNDINGRVWAYVCPKCYVEATRPVKIPSCLRDPERRKELLERYKE